MTVDNLISARVVLADGEVVVASGSENQDLFWGLRGGGGNFGVVTSFEFQAHSVGPEILSGLIVHPFSEAKNVLQAYREFLESAPDELTVWAVMRKAPPLPFLPEEVHGTEILILAAMYTGDISDGEVALAPLRAVGNPIADVIGPHPFVGWQQAFDPLLTPGERNYWKTHDFAAMSAEMIDTVLAYVATLPDPQSEVFFAHLGGAQGRLPEDATAAQGRSARYLMNIHGRWSDASLDEGGIGWCRNLWNAMGKYATGEAYVNFMTQEEGERLELAYGSSYERLVQLKDRYDAHNLFRMNQNIPPTV
jgi:FAD/FMN-containing dehydrogenase